MVGGFVILIAIGGVLLIGLLAMVLGIVALGRINRSNGALRGRGLAIAAIVIGGLMMLAPILGLPLLYLFSGARPEASAPAPYPSRVSPSPTAPPELPGE